MANKIADATDIVVEIVEKRLKELKRLEAKAPVPQLRGSTTFDITRFNALLPALNAQIPVHYLPASARPRARARAPPPPRFTNPSASYAAPAPPDIPKTGRYTELTFLPFLLKTLSKAMMERPLFRASLSTPLQQSIPGSAPTLTIRPNTDITLTVPTLTCEYNPTLFSVSSQTIYGLSSRISHISNLSRQTPSPPPEFFSEDLFPEEGGTVTVFDVEEISGTVDCINPELKEGGGVVIIALGRKRWVPDVGERRLMLNLSWSADRRVVDDAEMAAFLECWRKYTAFPEWETV